MREVRGGGFSVRVAVRVWVSARVGVRVRVRARVSHPTRLVGPQTSACHWSTGWCLGRVRVRVSVRIKVRVRATGQSFVSSCDHGEGKHGNPNRELPFFIGTLG